MNTCARSKSFLVFLITGITCIALSTPLQAADQDSMQVSELLSQAKMEAIRLREDANQMQNFVLNEVTWHTHGVYASMIAEDVTAMQEKVIHLDEARNIGSARQKAAIDQINPLLQELVAANKNVIQTLEKKPFDRTQYNRYLKANFDHAAQLAAWISASVECRKTRGHLKEASRSSGSPND